MNFKIDPKIFEKYPGLNIGLVIVRGIDNKGEAEEVMNLLKEEQRAVRENFDKGTLSENPKIQAWRQAYSSFGAKPKKYKCSVENLYRMILDGIELRHINKVVDLYNYVSIKYTIPVGGDDIEKVDGDIRLEVAEGDEPFIELNSEETKNPKEGEVIYRDDKEVLCRRWNWRECDKSKMTEDTKDVVIVVEGLNPLVKDDIEAIVRELAELIIKYCGGEVNTSVLDQEKSEIEV